MNDLSWDDVWAGGGKLNFLGRKLKKEEKKRLADIMFRYLPGRTSKILDVGCGTGSMLKAFRDLGYKEAIGIDNSLHSIRLCERVGLQEGRDVSLMDAAKLSYGENEFNMVFSEGLLEHFKDPVPIVGEMCRVSKRFVLLFQPNARSVVDRLKSFKEKRFGAKWQKEYHYTSSDYENMFLEHGFVLAESGKINFGELVWLLFEAK